MQIGAINRRARQQYAAFVSAMDMVRAALDEANKLVATMPKRPAQRVVDGVHAGGVAGAAADRD